MSRKKPTRMSVEFLKKIPEQLERSASRIKAVVEQAESLKLPALTVYGWTEAERGLKGVVNFANGAEQSLFETLQVGGIHRNHEEPATQ